MRWLLSLLYKNKVRLAAALTLYYYQQMKRMEFKFRVNKEWLLAISSCAEDVETIFGTAKISTVRQAVLDNDKLLQFVDHKQLLEMSTVRVNLVLKQMGNKFDTVVKSWYDDKRVLLLTNNK
jgi:hypothetical protein